MRRVLFITAIILGLFHSLNAQLTANGTPAPCQSLTSYTNSAPNDPIFYYQLGQLGSLTATPPSGTPGWTFAWSKYNPGTSSWVTLITQINLPSSTMNNLQQGAYRVTITDGTGTVVGCFRAWVLQITQAPVVTVAPITGSCNGPITLSGTVTNPQVTPYNNLPPDPMLINAQTQISVCYSANHTFVSDLGFHLKGPAQCGSPDIVLYPTPAICNGGDNLNNLCFTTSPAANLSVCGAPTPLTGTYSSANGVPINWTGLYGCDATAPGWRVEIWDCTFADQGTMTMGSVSFTGVSACGVPQTINYSSPSGFSSAIGVTSCSSNLSAGYAVVNPPNPSITCSFGYQWTSDPPVTIPNSTSSLNIPITSLTALDGTPMNWQDLDITLSLTSPCSGLVNCLGAAAWDSTTFEVQTAAAAVIDTPPAVCISGSAVYLTATPSAGIWSGTGITNGTTGEFNPAVAGIGSYQIVFAPADACYGNDTVMMVVTDVPVLVINSPNGFCINGAAYQFTSPTTGGTWSGTGISSSGMFDPATAGLGSHTITYNIGGGCPVSTTKTVTVYDLPTIGAGADATICSGSATQLQATGGVGYSWSPTAGISSPNNANTNATPPSNNFTYTVTGTDANGCSNTDSVTLTFFAGPSVTASNDPAVICPGTPTVITAQGTAASGLPGSYSWSPAAGVIGSSTASATVSPLQTTTYTVTFTDNCGLTATDQVVVTTELFQSITLPATAQYCAGESVTLTAVVTGTSPMLQWTSGVAGFDNTGHTSASLLVNQPGTYTLTATSPMGCVNTGQTTVAEVPLPNAYMPSPVDLCPNKTVVLNAGSNWNQVQWSNGAQTASTTVASPGVYTATITHNGCTNTASVTVVLIQMPVINLGPDMAICDGTVASLNIPVSGQWSTGVNASSIQVTTAGTYSAMVNIGSCVASDTIKISVKPRPVANLPEQVTGCLQSATGISAANPVNTGYLWNTGETTPVIDVKESGIYTVTTNNDCGSATDSTLAKIQDCTYAIYIPNTFTPDNDGINEVWKISTYNITKLTLHVFNRWGEVVFISHDLNPVWTGEINGGKYYYALNGVYTYHIYYETVYGELSERSGNVLIIR